MTWTYSGDPASSTRDAVRFLAGQASTGDGVVVSDEEIAYLVTEEGSAYRAAAAVCERLANGYAGLAQTRTVGRTSVTYAQRGQEYAARARDLRRRAALRDVQPYGGGTAVGDKQTVAADTSRVPTAFAVGMDDVGAASTGTCP
jgi:hypothetical protein